MSIRAKLLLPGFRAAVCVIVLFASDTGAQREPTIDVQPPQQLVLPGQQVRLTCRTGLPINVCRIQGPLFRSYILWDNRNSSNPREPVYLGDGFKAGQCGMLLASATEADDGEWKCGVAIEGMSSEISATATITVVRAPLGPEMMLTDNNGRTEYKAGDSVHATCSIRNGRPPANISWYIGDQQVTDGLSQLVETKGTLNNTWTVTQNLTRTLMWQDNGESLRCISQHMALTSNSHNQSTVPLRVQYPPQPHTSPIEKFGFEVGQEGVVAVTVVANPKPKVVWNVDGMQVQQGSIDPENHYQASIPNNLGEGTWEATLRITRVEEQDIQKQYTLTASNELGKETYKIALSTSSEPAVMELGAGSIIGIVVAILFVLLVIFLVIFARATGRWCFAGGVSSSRNDIRESSDTESADHGPAHRTKKPKMNLSYIFNKKKDKVSDEPPETPKQELKTQSAAASPQQKTGRGDIVYAELDLKDVTGKPRPQVRPEEERTEYAEIVYTANVKESDSPEKEGKEK